MTRSAEFRKVGYAKLRIIRLMGSAGLCVALGGCRWWGRWRWSGAAHNPGAVGLSVPACSLSKNPPQAWSTHAIARPSENSCTPRDAKPSPGGASSPDTTPSSRPYSPDAPTQHPTQTPVRTQPPSQPSHVIRIRPNLCAAPDHRHHPHQRQPPSATHNPALPIRFSAVADPLEHHAG